MWNILSPVLISTAVIAATVAAIANVIVTLMNNNRLRSIDNNNHRNDLIHYRYTKLYSILDEIEKEKGFANYVNDAEQTFACATEKRQRYIELYHLTRPLLENNIRNNLDAIAGFEDEKFVPIKVAILEKNIDAVNANLADWGNALNKFHNVLGAAVQEQMIALLET